MTITTLTRADLEKLFGNDPKVIRAFESLTQAVQDQASQLASQTDATEAINDATVITLSPNATFGNERVLALGEGLDAVDNGPGNTLVLQLTFQISTNGGYPCTFNLKADTNLDLPTEGTVPSSAIGPYADDAAAAAAGVAVGEWYAKTGGTVAWRVA